MRNPGLVLANSGWTRDVLRLRHGIHSEVLYPPLPLHSAAAVPEKKLRRFVSLGRIYPEKRIETVIEILKAVRARSHNASLHIIGDTRESAYGREVERMAAAEFSWVVLEGCQFGDAKMRLIADRTATIAALLTAGTAVHCLLSLPEIAQLAYGWTTLLLRSNVLALCLRIPLLLILTKYFGDAGAAAVWLIVHLSYIATNVIPMHRRLLTSEAKRWFCEDVGVPLIACSVTAAVLHGRMTWSNARPGSMWAVLLAGAIIGGVALIATPLTRQQIRERIVRKREISPIFTE